jgi:type IV pilus assembly protein PilV
VTHKKQQQRHHIAGFTLIEVLVALVIISVGMLGVAVLFADGIRLNRTSLYRTTAVALATDMAERIRSNQGAGYAGFGPGQPGNCDIGPTCTPDQLAEDDWWRWRQSLNAYLPTGTIAEIVKSPAGPGNRMNRFDISLSWPEIGSPDPVSYTLSVQL